MSFLINPYRFLSGVDFIYTVGEPVGVSNIATRKYDSSGNELTIGNWPTSHSQTLYAVTEDDSNNIFIVGTRGNGITTYKYDLNGNLLWTTDHGGTLYDVLIDNDGNVIVGGVPVSNKSLRKYDSNGNLLWSSGQVNTIYGIALDSSGNIITAGNEIYKYDSSGNEITTGNWPIISADTAYGVAIDSVGNIIIVTNRDYNQITTRKYDSNGNEITTGSWPVDHFSGTGFVGSSVTDVAIDSNDNVIAVGSDVDNKPIRKYDSDGVPIWDRDHGALVRGVVVDKYDNIIITGFRTGGNNITTRKYDSDGTLLWSVDHGDDTFGVSITK